MKRLSEGLTALTFASVVVTGCATAPVPETPAVETSKPEVPVADEPPPPPPAAAVPAPAPTPRGEPTPTASSAPERTADGIDDQNWMPRKDTPGYAAFTDANELLRRDPRAASQRFVAAASASPGFYGAWFNAGVAAEMAGDVAAAEGHYRQALGVRPDHGPSLVNLATLLAGNGRTNDAERLVADAVKASPARPGPRVAAAMLALRRRDLADAEREAREALGFDERNVPAMLVLTQVFRGQGRLDTARFAVDNALALEPGNALLHLERGHILVALNERQDALLAYERASRLRPTLAEALEPYGRLLLERGFAVEARAALDMLVKLRPRSGLAWLHLGNAQRANKDYPAADAAYRKALELDPALDEAHFNLGLLAIDNAVGDSDELVRLQKAVESFKLYQSRGRSDAATKARLNEYIEATEKRISREAKRRERDRKRQVDDAAKSAAPPAPDPSVPAPAAAGPTAATPAATPPTPAPAGAADDK